MAASREWYVAYNVIFNWFAAQYGLEGFDEYIYEITMRCFHEVLEDITSRGLDAVRDYYIDVFENDGTKYSVDESEVELSFVISQCIEYVVMKGSSYSCAKPCPHYCRHHRIMNEIFAKQCGASFSMTSDDNGRCEWHFWKEVRA